MISFLSFSLLMTVGKRNRNDFVKFLEIDFVRKVCVCECVGACVYIRMFTPGNEKPFT